VKLTYKVHTFGCKVNSYDSGLIEKRMSSDFELSNEPRIHVLNTCAVTHEATLEAGRLARKLKVLDPFCLVVATGCAAQVDTEELARQKAIDLIVANSHKTDLQNILKSYYNGDLRERVFKSNIFKKEDVEPGGGVDSLHTRSFLKIQDGCNSFCTFCVIPFARGKSRSIPIRDLVQRVRELENSGVQEIVMTGVHIGDYEDGNARLEDLIEAVLAQTTILRIRLSSLEPPELTDRLLALYASDRLCPHFHMSIQSAQSEVLKQMKRHYSADEVERALTAIDSRVKNAFVGMDVIAGFPTESDEQFEETYRRLEALPWTRLHVFPYSRRPGTFAARFPVLSGAVVKERAARLRRLSDERWLKHAQSQVGTKKRALQLRSRNGSSVALSRDFWTVEMPHTVGSAGEYEVLIVGVAYVEATFGPRLQAQALS
jgi:threonylcarbamoyladenosine tRNA methylthiotransferase MtaB